MSLDDEAAAAAAAAADDDDDGDELYYDDNKMASLDMWRILNVAAFRFVTLTRRG